MHSARWLGISLYAKSASRARCQPAAVARPSRPSWSPLDRGAGVWECRYEVSIVLQLARALLFYFHVNYFLFILAIASHSLPLPQGLPHCTLCCPGAL